MPQSAPHIITIESRRSKEIPLSTFLKEGHLEIFPSVESRGIVTLNFRGGFVKLSAGKYIGTVPLSRSVTLDIRPKFPVANLRRVLEVAGSNFLPLEDLERYYAEYDRGLATMTDIMLLSFSRAMRPIAKEGYHKEYQRQRSETSSPRGRILTGATMASWGMRGTRHRVAVEAYAQELDIPENRVLRSAFERLLAAAARGAVTAKKEMLASALEAFASFPSSVSNATERDISQVERILAFRALPQSRSYSINALRLALMILRGGAFDIHFVEDAEFLSDALIVDFEAVYEKYIRSRVTDLSGSEFVVFDGNTKAGSKPLYSDRASPPAQPDIVLRKPSTSAVLVADVKYKDSVDRSSVNQVVTYALSYESRRCVVIHECSASGTRGDSYLGSIEGIKVYSFGLSLGDHDVEDQEKALTRFLCKLLEEELGSLP